MSDEEPKPARRRRGRPHGAKAPDPEVLDARRGVVRRLREAMGLLNLTPEQLAERFECELLHVTDVLHLRDELRDGEIYVLRMHFHLSPAWLLLGEGRMHDEDRLRESLASRAASSLAPRTIQAKVDEAVELAHELAASDPAALRRLVHVLEGILAGAKSPRPEEERDGP